MHSRVRIKLDAEHREKYTILYLCVLLSFGTVQGAFSSFIRLLIGNTYKIDTLIAYSVLILLFILSIRYILRSLMPIDLLVVLGLPFIIVFASLLPDFPDGSFSDILTEALFYCVPMYAAVVSVKDRALLLAYLRITGWVLLISNSFLIFGINYYALNGRSHSLEAGYSIAMSFVLILSTRKNALDTIAMVYLLFLMFVAAARGPMVTTACVVILYLLLFSDKRKKRFWMMLVILVISALIIFSYWNLILTSLILLLNQMGINTRVISSLLNNSIAIDNERNALIGFALEYAEQHLFMGSFPICDRTIIYEKVGKLAYLQDPASSYAHNIFLEWMIQFGGFWGMILFVLFCIGMARSCLAAKQKEDKSMALIGIAIGFLPLMMSFSYIVYPAFYFLLGLMLSRKRRILRRLGYTAQG